MKKNIIWAILFILMISTEIFAAIIVDGNLSDWGTINPSGGIWKPDGSAGAGLVGAPLTGTSSNGVTYWIEDGVLGGGYVEPGYGGQTFDIEALYTKIEGNTLYFAASVGGLPPGGSQGYVLGDIALRFGTDYTYGLATTNHTTTTGNVSAGSLYSVTGWTSAIHYPVSNPSQIGSFSGFSGPGNGLAFAYNATTYGIDHYIIEASIPLNLIGNQLPNNLHLTQTCGNDAGNVAVPEPSSMLLLGLGLITISGIVRKAAKMAKK